MDPATAYRTYCSCALELARPFEETTQGRRLLEGGGESERDMAARLKQLRRQVEQTVAAAPGQILRLGVIPGVRCKRYARMRTANSTRVITSDMIEAAAARCTPEAVRAELATAKKQVTIIDLLVKIIDREVRRMRTTLRESLIFCDEAPRDYPESQIVFAPEHLRETVGEMERLKARLGERRKLRGGYEKELKGKMAEAETVVLDDLRRRETTAQPLTINFRDEPRKYNVRMRTSKKKPSVTVPIFRNLIRDAAERKWVSTLTPQTTGDLLHEDALADFARVLVQRFESFRTPRETITLKLEAVRTAPKRSSEDANTGARKRSHADMEEGST